MSCTASKIVAQAQAWVGLKESDGSHKKIIDIYNTLKPLPRGYKLKYTDFWCAGTTSALAVACNATDIIPVECSCLKLIEKAKAMGIWVESDAYTPAPGDLMLYDWDDSGKGDNKNSPDHVGIVEKVTGSTITVIEGNYSNAVKRRKIQVNGRYIRGYIVPKYDAEPVVEKPAEDDTKAQEAASYTKKQFIKDVQKACGAAVDGIAGPETIRKTRTLSAKKNAQHAAVKSVQKRLYTLGYTEVGKADGIAGPKFTSAVAHFQQDNGCVVDGEITHQEKTWRKLLGME